MSSEFLTKVNTKLKAYKLIHDPVILLNLLFSKYGDIEEDYELLYINQLVKQVERVKERSVKQNWKKRNGSSPQ